MIKIRNTLVGIALFSTGLLIGNQDFNSVKAQDSYPTKNLGLFGIKLGVISEDSMTKQTGLESYVLKLSVVTMEPGGQIKKHDHSTRPGLVYTLEGSWTEGRPGGENEYPAGSNIAIKEDFETEHWFYNRTEKPVKFIICDLDNR